MIITFEIADDQAASIEQYIRTQQKIEVDEVTGAPRVVYPHDNAEDFILDNIWNLIHSVLQQYPTPEMRVQMAEAKRLNDQLKACARPKKCKAEKA